MPNRIQGLWPRRTGQIHVKPTILSAGGAKRLTYMYRVFETFMKYLPPHPRPIRQLLKRTGVCLLSSSDGQAKPHRSSRCVISARYSTAWSTSSASQDGPIEEAANPNGQVWCKTLSPLELGCSAASIIIINDGRLFGEEMNEPSEALQARRAAQMQRANRPPKK
ncbi:hypothetical protein PAAG_02345 [Paracoccidioides lutzii Pb01]|uniref:Uncharacterized protein n=1 Tax=Paracoccidioides lutzii (strain ATCC MYA-826 / Pb01) TaxID=502779 RepID=C1GUM2_PARBA|nr:hypothetical protein PAAG_02345 [Paracoccidioides lutzii Pb01]EEH40290.2 hypothetical protein PAAG_02345 [Paracoccidioides lutzii Pb01]